MLVEQHSQIADSLDMLPPKIPYFAVAAASIAAIYCIFLGAAFAIDQPLSWFSTIALMEILGIPAGFLWLVCTLAALVCSASAETGESVQPLR